MFKNSKFFYVLVLAMMPFFVVAQDCSIESVQYELQECNDGVFYIHLVVNAVNPGAEGFSVLGNGHDYGDFSYESTFIEIGPLEGNGETPYEFVVIDNQFEGCSNFVVVGQVDCTPPQCGIFDVVLDFQSCNEQGQYNYVLNFEYANTSNVGFDVYLGDDFLGFFHYEELPVHLPAFGPLNNEWFYLQVCDNDNPNCCSGIEMMIPDCPVSDDCFIENVVVEAHPCEEGVFYVDLEVQGGNFGTQGFTVHGNGQEYGTFSYESAFVTIGPLEGNGETVYEFIVTDVEFPDCHNFAGLGPVDCTAAPCAFEIAYEEISCHAFVFFTSLDQQVSWFLNDEYFGFSAVKEFVFESPGTYQICAAIETPDCPQGYFVCETIVVGEDCFNSCSFEGITMNFEGCADNGSYFYALNFEPFNNVGAYFDLYIQEEFFGYFAYEELPLLLEGVGPFESEAFHVTICDNDNPDCCLTFTVETPSCGNGECVINHVIVEAHECNEDGYFYVDLEVVGANFGSEGYSVVGNGNDYGDFSYEEPYITLGPFAGDGESIYEFVVIDNQYGDCSNHGVIGPIDCFADPCAFEIWYEEHSCHSFTFFTSPEQHVDWFVNDEYLGFAAVKDIEFNHPGTYEICALIETPDCPLGYSVCETIVVGEDCFSECGFGEVSMHFEGCNDNGSYNYALNFIPVNPTNALFDLYIQEEYVGSYPYEELPVWLEGVGPFESEYFHVKICDNDNPDCCKVFEVMTPDCGGNGDCVINHVIVEAHECNEDGYFYVDLEVVGANFGSEGYSVVGNGNDYGDFSYEEPFITLGPFAGDGESVYEFVVIDNQIDNCAGEAVIGPIDCFADPCAFEIGYEEHSCHSFTFFTSPEQHVNWFINDEYLGFAAVKDIEFNHPGTYEICALIETPDCPLGYSVCETIVVGEDCFSECGFGEVSMHFEGCNDNGSYNYALNFIPVNPTNAFFDLYIQEEYIGSYPYEELPVWLEGVGPFESEYFHVKICDNDNPDCCKVFEVMTPDCGGNGDCVINHVIVEPYECNEEGYFYVDLVVVGENFGSEGYSVVGNGNDYGDFSYDEPFITLGPFAGDGESVYEFVVIDNQYGDCSNYGVIGPIDCNPGECGFDEVAMHFEGCNDNGSYNFSLNFEPINPTNAYFDLYIQEEFVGYYAYEELPIWLEGVGPFESEYFHVKICDNDNPDCCKVFEVMTPECGGGNECNFWDVVVEPHITDCNNGIFSVDVAFNSSNTGLLGYYIFANGDIFGPFSYALPFVTIGPFEGDGNTQYDFLILDIMNPACYTYYEFGTFECEEDVWPGDTNSDNIANHFDLLNIGIAYGTEGPHREDDNTEWDAMPAENWSQFFEDNTNFKHADSNGDGVVNSADINAIQQNFLFTHGDVEDFIPLPGTEIDPPVYMDVPDNLTAGAPFEIPVMLGTEGEPVNDIYGIAFSIEIDPELINVADMEISFPTSWMGEPGVNIITFNRVDEESSTLYVAISRNDQNNVSGYGPVMYLHGIIDDIAGIHQEIELKATQINAIDLAQNPIPLNNPFKTSLVTKVREEDTDFVSLLMNTWITPNPASGEIMIWNKHNVPVKAITIFDMSGTRFGQTFTNTNKLSVDYLPAGLYAVRLEMGDHVIMKKLVKVQQ